MNTKTSEPSRRCIIYPVGQLGYIQATLSHFPSIFSCLQLLLLLNCYLSLSLSLSLFVVMRAERACECQTKMFIIVY